MAYAFLPLMCQIDLSSINLSYINNHRSHQVDEGTLAIISPNYNNIQRKITIRYIPLLPDDRDTIKSFLDLYKTNKPFNITYLDDSEITVKYVKDSLKESFAKGKFIISLELLEVFE